MTACSQRFDKHELYRPALGLRQAPNGLGWLVVPAWENLSWLWHGFSTRQGGLSRAYCAEGAPGELNLTFTPHDQRDRVVANRRLLAEAITGASETPILTVRQIHSALVVIAGADAQTEPVPEADGLITSQPGLLIAIQTADCIPVLVADPKRRVVAAFHAGWRGTVQRIVEHGIARMGQEFGSRTEDLLAAVGPGIGPCCYAVGHEVATGFESNFDYAAKLFYLVGDAHAEHVRSPLHALTQRPSGDSVHASSLHLDLQEANRRQLLASGLRPAAIHMTRGCTLCQQELFFSHRGSQGRTGRMLSVIGIRP